MTPVGFAGKPKKKSVDHPVDTTLFDFFGQGILSC
jgi:hypothetical protein